MTRRSRVLQAAIAAVALLGLFGVWHAGLLSGVSPSYAAEQQSQPVLTAAEQGRLTDLSRAIRKVAQSVRRSVVHVTVKEFIKHSEADPHLGIPEDLREQLRRFFGRDLPAPFDRPRPGPPARPRERTRTGLGSGIIFDRRGHILTNNHVVEDADKIDVVTTDGRTYSAKVVGTDPLTDLAVLKIEADDLPPANFGDSDAVEVGDLVLAVGNPFGFDYSVTFGIISAKGRRVPGLMSIYYQDFLQTDAAINPGNSGGPLVNIKGEVIGVNTAIATRTGQYAGVSFAIPVNLARQIAEVLIKEGKVTRGWLGVQITDLTPGLAKSFGLKEARGVLINDVVADSPASKAGFRRGDIILEMNGEPIRNSAHLQRRVTLTRPGTEVTFKVWRDGKSVDLEAKLAELNEEDLRDFRTRGLQERRRGEEDRREFKELGITVATPTEELAKKYGWSETPQGTLVVEVDPKGELADLGIRPGDVIESVQGVKVRSARDFAKAMKRVSLAEGFRMWIRNPVYGGRFIFVQKQ